MKITMQWEDREINTLADLVHKELHRGGDHLGLYQRRSLVRLAVAVQALAKGFDNRWAVLAKAPRWVYAYLSAPLFPEAKPVRRSRPVVMVSRHTEPPRPKHKPKRKRPIAKAAEAKNLPSELAAL